MLSLQGKKKQALGMCVCACNYGSMLACDHPFHELVDGFNCNLVSVSYHLLKISDMIW